MTKLQKQVITTALVLSSLFSVFITSHATYNYLDNTGKLDYLSTEAK